MITYEYITKRINLERMPFFEENKQELLNILNQLNELKKIDKIYPNKKDILKPLVSFILSFSTRYYINNNSTRPIYK